MKNLLQSISKTLLCFLILSAVWSCEKEEDGRKIPPESSRLNYVKNVSSVWHYEGNEVKKQYEITYDEAWLIESIKYMNGEGTVTSEEHFDFQVSAIEIAYESEGDNGTHYPNCHMPLGLDGLVQSFYYEGSEQKWHYAYDNERHLTSLAHSERGDGMTNILWSGGNMAASDLVWYTLTENDEPFLQKEPLTCSYSPYFNNYSIDINALVNTFLYPSPGSLMPWLQGVSSVNLLSRFTYTDPEVGDTHLAVKYKTDEDGVIQEMTVTDLDYAEVGEENYTVYTFTYCSPYFAAAN